ncbi:hypothetical protein V7200_21205, partial [Cytobacillus firmus]|nr:hypothetical protein [Cytobacillus firmus]
EAEAEANNSFDNNRIIANTGHNVMIGYCDNNASFLAIALSQIALLEALRGNQSSSNDDLLIASLKNSLQQMNQEGNSNRQAILDAIKHLKKED